MIRFGGEIIAETRNALRMLETSHPPTYYLPPGDVESSFLHPLEKRSFCEWKGSARYFDVVAGGCRAEGAAWTYKSPSETFPELRDHIAFYAGCMSECLVDGERAKPQPGGFYGGWVTSKVVGPFKGEPGSWGW